ncbi:MAG: hypothetical protein ACTSRA_16645 [Promethearchaeota archaeon]
MTTNNTTDMPVICSITYGSSTHDLGIDPKGWSNVEWILPHSEDVSMSTDELMKKYNEQFKGGRFQMQETEEEKMAEGKKRFVRVFIVDPDENVPVEDSLLYSSDEMMTDLNDMELYYEIDMKTILEEHNEKRVKMKDKEASNKFGKDIFLEPVKIRDLTMTVVNIAIF